MNIKQTRASYFILSSFNHCFFISMLLLAFCGKGLLNLGIRIEHLFIANAVLSLFVVYFIYSIFAKKKYFQIYTIQNLKSLLFLSIITGMLSTFAVLYPIMNYLLTIIITALTIKNIRLFAKKILQLLDCDAKVSVHNLIEFFDFFVNLILTFTIVNFSVYLLSLKTEVANAFNFSDSFGAVIDSLYFTIMMLTTVGFGDITPKTELAKIIISFECLVSYVMFGLMIGIISRGVELKK